MSHHLIVTQEQVNKLVINVKPFPMVPLTMSTAWLQEFSQHHGKNLMLHINIYHFSILSIAFPPFSTSLPFFNFTILSSFFVLIPCSAPCLRPHRIVQQSHCICNSFLYPSYWVSFEPVSQGVCQIWTLQLTFFPLLLVFGMISGRVTDTQKGEAVRGNAFPT